MNKNIEVINENLWAVNFDFVRMGLVKELSFNNENPSDYATFTQDGKMILNKNQEYYGDILKYMNTLMGFSVKQLGSIQGFHDFIKAIIPSTNKLTDQAFKKFINCNKLESVEKMFYNLSDLEKKRRIVHSEFHRNNKKPSKFNGIFKRLSKQKG